MHLKTGLMAVAGIATILCTATMNPAFAETKRGFCKVTSGSVGGHRYVTLQCKKSAGSDYNIRSTSWERDGKESYRKLVVFSGRSFTCDLVSEKSSYGFSIRSDNYKIQNCR